MAEIPIPAAARAILYDCMTEEELQASADCRLTQVRVRTALRAVKVAMNFFLPYAQHPSDCLSRKGAHYGPESCDCGLRQLYEALEK